MHALNLLAVTDGAVFAGFGATALVIGGVILLLSVFWLWMLIDCLSSSLPPTEKLIWFLVIFFLHFVGAVLYYAMVRSTHRPGMI